MVDLLIKILAVLGIILLVLLGICLLCLLLVLFFPVTYRIVGEKDESKQNIFVRAGWLFGLFRVKFVYPKPGSVRVKLLWFTLFDSKAEKKPKNDSKTAQKKPKPKKTTSAKNSAETDKNAQAKIAAETFENAENTTEAEQKNSKGIKHFILEKYDKIQYTFQSIYDKIKHIWENITYYKELLQEEDTGLLFDHALMRLGKILKALRPRKLNARILFGTGEPDTTGYVYGIYNMLLPFWDISKVVVIPDFQQKIFEGRLSAAGHITVFQLLRHGVLLALDKRLKVFIHKAKAGRNEDGR